MAIITIKKTDNYKAAENFNISEFFSNSAGVTSHPFNNDLILAVQAIRTLAKVPVHITSTYRTSAHNLAIGGASKSQHLTGNAVDWTISDREVLSKIQDELRIYKHNHPAIKSIGVGGIGIYDTFVHFDMGGAGRFWDEKKKST